MQQHKKGMLLMLDSNLRHPTPEYPPAAAPSPAVAPKVDQPVKAGKAHKGRKADKPGTKKAHKEAKPSKQRAAVQDELAGIAVALRELRGRVSDLHALHLDSEGQGAGLEARLDALGAEQARVQEVAAALGARVESMAHQVDVLSAESAVIGDTLADLAVQPDRDTALFALEDRIQAAEETLFALRELVGQGPTQVPGDLGQRLDALRQALATQDERLAGLEDIRVGEGTDGADAGRLEHALQTLGASVDDRVASLERDLGTLRDQNRRWREAERSWAEERLSGLGRGLAGGIGLLALLLLAGFVATWWHGERQLDLIAARITAVEQGTEARLATLAGPDRQTDAALGDAIAQLGATMEGIQATNAELGARLSERVLPPPDLGPVETRMADLQARLGVLEQVRNPVSLQASAELPVPSEGAVPLSVSAPDSAAKEASEPASTGASEPPEQPAGAAPTDGPATSIEPVTHSPADPPVDPGAPVASEQPGVEQVASAPATPTPVVPVERYALQLIGFRSQASIAPFADKHGIGAQTRWLRAPGRGRPWYLVLLGNYASRAEAEAALADLPDGLRSLSPLVRPLTDGAQPLVTD